MHHDRRPRARHRARGGEDQQHDADWIATQDQHHGGHQAGGGEGQRHHALDAAPQHSMPGRRDGQQGKGEHQKSLREVVDLGDHGDDHGADGEDDRGPGQGATPGQGAGGAHRGWAR
jgi:hypothetical protein